MLPSKARGLSLINDVILKINLVRIRLFYQDIKPARPVSLSHHNSNLEVKYKTH